MNIELTKHGGLAAGIRRPPVCVKSSDLPEADATELRRLVAAVRDESLPINAGPGQVRDGMSYAIAVEESDGTKSEYRVSDGQMSDAFAELLTWIERRSKG
ncbi:MAG: hypothetical protein H6818_21800 [Phycisphaerales bacterium]|nr:hypothetical protein [Phycisphaerales bacterium]MCB9862426.1 hypothetical protein [Phycisphaerales bacterium]